MRRLTLVLIAILALSFVALAQDFPRAEVNAGYSYARVQTGAPTSFGAVNASGFGGGLNLNFKKNVGVFADVSYNLVRKTGRTDDRVTNFLFGPQFTYRSEARLSPFGRFYAGAVHCNDGFVVGTPLNPSITLPATTTWAYGFGGGVDARLTNIIFARLAQVDFIRSHFTDYHQNNVRISMGIVFKLGGKAK